MTENLERKNVDPGPLGGKVSRLRPEDIRAEVVNELGDLIFGDFTRIEKLMAHGSTASTQALENEIKRWDSNQKKKWSIIKRYKDVPSLELENLVFMEFKRIFLMVQRLEQMKKAAVHKVKNPASRMA